MDEKTIRREVHNYQFVVYTPQEKRYIKNGLILEIAGHIYPYRRKRFNIEWLGAFLTEDSQRWYWDQEMK